MCRVQSVCRNDAPALSPAVAAHARDMAHRVCIGSVDWEELSDSVISGLHLSITGMPGRSGVRRALP